MSEGKEVSACLQARRIIVAWISYFFEAQPDNDQGRNKNKIKSKPVKEAK